MACAWRRAAVPGFRGSARPAPQTSGRGVGRGGRCGGQLTRAGPAGDGVVLFHVGRLRPLPVQLTRGDLPLGLGLVARRWQRMGAHAGSARHHGLGQGAAERRHLRHRRSIPVSARGRHRHLHLDGEPRNGDLGRRAGVGRPGRARSASPGVPAWSVRRRARPRPTCRRLRRRRRRWRAPARWRRGPTPSSPPATPGCWRAGWRRRGRPGARRCSRAAGPRVHPSTSTRRERSNPLPHRRPGGAPVSSARPRRSYARPASEASVFVPPRNRGPVGVDEPRG